MKFKKLNESNIDTYKHAMRIADSDAKMLRDRYDIGEESPFDILISLGYEQDDPNSVYMYKECEGDNAAVFDFSDYENGKPFIKYFVVDEDNKIPQGWTSTKLMMENLDNDLDEALEWDTYLIEFKPKGEKTIYSDEYEAADKNEALWWFRKDYPEDEYDIEKMYKLTDEGYEDLRYFNWD